MDASTRARLLGLFVSEAETTLTGLAEEARRLTPDGGAASLRDFGRSAHGLKGAASTMELVHLARTLHDLERFALALPGVAREGWEAHRERLVHAVELLREGVATMAESGLFPPGILEQVAQELGATDRATAAESPVAGSTGPSPAPAPPLAPEAPVATPGPAEPLVAERISVPAEDIDTALRMVSALARGLSMLEDQLRDTPTARQLETLTLDAARLETTIATLRMVPAQAAISGLEADVARLARELGKEVAFEVRGLEVRADRRTLSTARRLIGHLVRNALDHGLEAPAARFAADKPVTGLLRVRFELQDSTLKVTVEDDGAGFDVPAIRSALVQRGEDPKRIEALADAEVLHRFALAGGSTRAKATLVSGRGLGLSAVADLARAAGGEVTVSSQAGKGSRVQFTLPPEVYALEVLSVRAQARWVGLPASSVERVVHAREAIGADARTLAVDESIVPYVTVAQLLGERAAPCRFAAVVKAGEGALALGAEDLGTLQWLVPHAVPGVASKDSLVLGFSHLSEGGFLPILNPQRLGPDLSLSQVVPEPRAPLDLVLAEDSLATREVLRVLLQARGYQVRLAGDGDEALGRIAERMPDVVVTDLNMPRRDGLSLTRALRARPDTAHLPIILLTSQSDEECRAAGAAAGADAHLLKSSFNADVLEQTLQRLGVRGRP